MAAVSYICRRNILLNILKRNVRLVSQSSSTSGQQKSPSGDQPCSDISKIPDFSKPLENKNWVSYGFSTDSRVEDRYYTHFFMFYGFTVIFCGVCFLTYFYPDRNQYDWARREAYIRLHERERLGLDAIDKNFIDPALITLPPDEDIGEDEIII